MSGKMLHLSLRTTVQTLSVLLPTETDVIRFFHNFPLILVQDCMNYFRAVLKSGEKSPRVLGLLNDVIEVNAANYTAWLIVMF